MSDQDKSQPSGQDESNPGERPQSERERAGGGGSIGASTGGGRPRHGRNRRRSSSPQQQSGQSRDPEPSFNLNELRELVELFTSNGLSEFEFENEDIRVRLSRNAITTSHAPSQTSAPMQTPASALASQAASGTSAAGSSTTGGGASSHAAAGDADADAGDGLQVITAPIVGTFYRSPSPEADPFIRPGSHVEADTTVCIIEAMKLMNEIPAEMTGTVEKIYVENGQPVEYGQPLFGIRK